MCMVISARVYDAGFLSLGPCEGRGRNMWMDVYSAFFFSFFNRLAKMYPADTTTSEPLRSEDSCMYVCMYVGLEIEFEFEMKGFCWD